MASEARGWGLAGASGATRTAVATGALVAPQASGIARSGGAYVTAAASPRVALYLETAGGLILLIAGVGGLLLGPSPRAPVQTS